MCLYPQRIRNPRYLPNKKNHFSILTPADKRMLWIEVPCGRCVECGKMKATSWRFRLEQEIKDERNKKCLFVTLTFNSDAFQELEMIAKEKENYTDKLNCMAKTAVKRFRERWRKEFAKSPKHWLVTELGGENGRLHLHGILFEDTDNETIQRIWKYGFTYTGEYVNEKTINYIVKYIYKQSDVNRLYTPIVLTSPGIGKKFFESYDCQQLSVERTKVRLRNGIEIEAPTYYKQKQLSEEQKIKLHAKNLDKQETWVDGIKYKNTPENEKLIYTMKKQAMKYYESLGYLSEYEIDMIRREKKRKKK